MLVYIDPGYLDGIGHYENYARRLREGAHKRGIALRHFVNLGVPEKTARRHALEPLFPHRPAIGAEVYGDPDQLAHYIDTFAAKIRLILRQVLNATPRDCRIRFFMYTGHPRLLPVVAEFMNSGAVAGRDVTFCFNIFYVSNAFATRTGGGSYVSLVQDIARDLEHADPAGRVRLFSDSRRIINAYARYFLRPIDLLPIPLGGRAVSAVGERVADAVITLGYLGYTHAKQGYPFILRLYRDLLANPEYRHVRLKVRHNIFNIEAANIAVLRELVGSRERIENAVNYQSPEAYETFLKECDILLIPHSRFHYPVQTSGMLIDTLCRAKPVVVPENTWLSDQIVRYGAGVTFSGTDYGSFRDAVFEAIEEASELYAQSTRDIESFAAFHSPERLLEALFHQPSPVARVPAAVPVCTSDCVELLDLDLLDRDPAFTELIYAEKIARRKNLGWHYMLDLTWIAAQLKTLPAGSLVLDAGAGNGLLQYVLLRMGLRVISVDFVRRRGPADTDWLEISAGERFDNAYVRHLRDNYPASGKGSDEERTVRSAQELTRMLENESARLIFYRADLAAMTLLPDGLVDAVVSVSALEHNDQHVTARAVDECLRVLKSGRQMLATVGAVEHRDQFHEPSKGWCYSEPTLRRLFRLADEAECNYAEYQRISKQLSAPGNELHIQLAPFYFASGNNGMPWGRWRPEYLPVGVRKIKVSR